MDVCAFISMVEAHHKCEYRNSQPIICLMAILARERHYDLDNRLTKAFLDTYVR